jgi:hypothetical protein
VNDRISCWHSDPNEREYARIGKIVVVRDSGRGWFVLFFPEWYAKTNLRDPILDLDIIGWNVATSSLEDKLDDPIPVGNIEQQVIVSFQI